MKSRYLGAPVLAHIDAEVTNMREKTVNEFDLATKREAMASQLRRIEAGLTLLFERGALARIGHSFVALDGHPATVRIAELLTAASRRSIARKVQTGNNTVTSAAKLLQAPEPTEVETAE